MTIKIRKAMGSHRDNNHMVTLLRLLQKLVAKKLENILGEDKQGFQKFFDPCERWKNLNAQERGSGILTFEK